MITYFRCMAWVHGIEGEETHTQKKPWVSYPEHTNKVLSYLAETGNPFLLASKKTAGRKIFKSQLNSTILFTINI